MAVAGKWKVYEQFKFELGEGGIDLTAGTFKMALFTSASNANTLSVNKAHADLTNEVANGFGYTTGGVTLTTVTYTNAAGTETFTSANALWTAAGGSITWRYAVVRKSGTFLAIVDPIICVMVGDTAPADVITPDGQQVQITINAGGIWTLSGATSD